ncbi:MAG: hypothetical protein J7K87_02630 [Candidatus Aenigmarchaeota archaeon]|nr:hypothetical protein [Candidatus Aenigmarchaeota archaeon]
MIPLSSIRNALKQNSDHHITQEAVVRAKDFLEIMLREFATEVEREFNEYNDSRRRQGLRKKKRIPAWIVRSVSTKFLNRISDNDMGSQVEKSVSPGGEK